MVHADLWTAEQTADVASRQAGGVRLDVPHAPKWMQALAEKPLVDSGLVPEKFFDAWVREHLTLSMYATADCLCLQMSMQRTSTCDWHTGRRPSTCIMMGVRASSPTLMIVPASPGPSSLSGSSRTRDCPLAPSCMGELSLPLSCMLRGAFNNNTWVIPIGRCSCNSRFGHLVPSATQVH